MAEIVHLSAGVLVTNFDRSEEKLNLAHCLCIRIKHEQRDKPAVYLVILKYSYRWFLIKDDKGIMSGEQLRADIALGRLRVVDPELFRQFEHPDRLGLSRRLNVKESMELNQAIQPHPECLVCWSRKHMKEESPRRVKDSEIFKVLKETQVPLMAREIAAKSGLKPDACLRNRLSRLVGEGAIRKVSAKLGKRGYWLTGRHLPGNSPRR